MHSLSQIRLLLSLRCLRLLCTFYQIGVGNEVSLDELMDVASEPHEFNIYLATNVSALTLNISDQLSNVLCNSKHPQQLAVTI